MALCTMYFRGASIQKDAMMNVLLPDGEGPFPVLYLLHGLSDDFSKWTRQTSIERYVSGLPLIVVMPDGQRSFYCNDPRPGGSPFEDHIVRDVVGIVDRTFPTIRSRRGRAIAGLSMGGYGALKLALQHPDVFCAACSHSGAPNFAHAPNRRPEVQAFADALPKGRNDCYTLARRLQRSGRKVAIRIDCGIEDRLLEANRQFHAYLERLGIPHEYAEYPGGHSWEYWDEHIRQTLGFVLEHLRRPAARRKR